MNSSGIILTNISSNTSCAYEEKKASINLHLPPPEKKCRENGEGGCIDIDRDLLSRFEPQTGTKEAAKGLRPFCRGPSLQPGQKVPKEPRQKGLCPPAGFGATWP
jgi:hypothetical protein